MGKINDPIRAVLVGCGAISSAWLRAAAAIPDIRIVGLVDLREEAARQRAAEFKLANAVIGTALPDVLAATQPDVVFDCTVPAAHYEVVSTALRHGCHVLGEKPLADSLDHARELVALAQQTGRQYAVIQNRRYQPAIRRVRSVVAQQTLGALTTINSDFYIGAHFGGFRDRMQHVLLLDMAIHTFDAARFISGADPVAVYCKEWNPRGSWYDHGAAAMAIFEMSGGLIYSYRGSWCAEGCNTTWEAEWRIIGERGSLTWDGADGFRLQTVAKTGSFQSELEDQPVPPWPTDEKTGGHLGLLREFVECVRTGKTPETAAADNIKSLAMVFAAIESAETGRRVLVEI